MCLCRGYDGCCVFCLYCEAWSGRCSCMGMCEYFVMQMLYVCVLCASCGSSHEFCMTCSLLMLVEDAIGDHTEEAYSRASLITAL